MKLIAFMLLLLGTICLADEPAKERATLWDSAKPVDAWVKQAGIGLLRVKAEVGDGSTTQPALIEPAEVDVRRHATLIATRANVAEALKLESISNTPWRKAIASDDAAADWLAEHLDVRVIDGTRLIGIGIKGEIDAKSRGVLIAAVGTAYRSKTDAAAQRRIQQRSIELQNLKIRQQVKMKAVQDQMSAMGDLTSNTSVRAQNLKKAFDETDAELRNLNRALDALHQLSQSDVASLEWVVVP